MPNSRQSIDDTAAAWLGRRDGGLTPAEEAEFTAWRRADPRHEAAFARLAAGAEALERLGELRPAGAVDPDLPLVRRRRASWWPLGLAAAAAVVVGWFTLRPIAPPPARPALAAADGLRKMNLPDGSVVDLNTGAAVEVAFTAGERRVRLARGEAHFGVTKDAGRPFVVEAAGVAVRAVGTAFSVRMGATAIDVLVTEGMVRVDDARGTSLLSPQPGGVAPVVAAGERVKVAIGPAATAPATVVRAEPAEIARLLAWKERRLEFDPTPLAEIVAAFNRVNRHQIEISDPVLATLLVGGSFRADDPDTLVRLLEANFGVTAERETGRTLLRTKR